MNIGSEILTALGINPEYVVSAQINIDVRGVKIGVEYYYPKGSPFDIEKKIGRQMTNYELVEVKGGKD